MARTYKIDEEFNPDKIYYFDNNATTFIYDQDVIKEINDWLNSGNPSNNLHIAGILAKRKIDESRKIIANDLKVEPEEIFFTGNATEANNILIQGIINKQLKNNTETYTIITTNFEHPSVLNIFEHYKTNNRINVVYVKIKTDKNDKYY